MEWLKGRAGQQFDAFVADSTDILYRTGYLLTWDSAETEDLLQETFIRVARRWGRVRAMEHPIAYARRILVNLALDGAPRRSRRHFELDADEETFDRRSDQGAIRMERVVEDASEFRWALAQLPRQQRAVLVLRYWEDLSEAETADALGCSVGTVKKATWRATARLRHVLTDDDGATPAVPHPPIKEGRPR